MELNIAFIITNNFGNNTNVKKIENALNNMLNPPNWISYSY